MSGISTSDSPRNPPRTEIPTRFFSGFFSIFSGTKRNAISGICEHGTSSASRRPALFSSRTMMKSHFWNSFRSAILFFTCLISSEIPRYTIVVPARRATLVRKYHCRMRELNDTPSSLSKRSPPPPTIRISARQIVTILRIRYQILPRGFLKIPWGKYVTHETSLSSKSALFLS
jgi:hypothetical protein